MAAELELRCLRYLAEMTAEMTLDTLDLAEMTHAHLLGSPRPKLF